MRRFPLLVCLAFAALAGLSSPQATARASQQPARDTPAQSKNAPPPPDARITGRILAADTGRPVKRARVFVRAAELPEGRAALSDDGGVFELADLPGGRYTVTASKAGFVSLSFGQRRPLQAGTPLQLAAGQQLKGVDFRLPRGSVIAGRVLDEDGEPMPGAGVRVMRYQYLQGARRLTPAGTAQTDDRGQYRVWGLMPGDYYVSAVVRSFNGFGGRGARGGGGPPSGDDEESLTYAPTYYPGVPSVNDARPVAVGLAQETLDINFNLQLVHTGRVAGHVTDPDGTPATSGNVVLMTDGSIGRGSPIGVSYGSRIDWDGSFAVANVPPGRYTLRARGDDAETPQYASQPITVAGGDIGDLTVILAPGASISGAVTFPQTATPLPDLTQVRVTAPSIEPGIAGPNNARVDKDGHFSIDGLAAGRHVIRPQGPLRGWSLKSVVIDGRDVTDVPIELRSAQRLADVVVTFTDAQTEINGTLADDHGVAVTDGTILVFSTDTAYWGPLSRHIMTARPDQTGTFRIRGLPAGDYYIVAVDPSEQGEWFDPAYLEEHRAAASKVTVGEGETKSQNLKVKS
jgi:carboxypeptidase family protein